MYLYFVDNVIHNVFCNYIPFEDHIKNAVRHGYAKFDSFGSLYIDCKMMHNQSQKTYRVLFKANNKDLNDYIKSCTKMCAFSDQFVGCSYFVIDSTIGYCFIKTTGDIDYMFYVK